MADCIVTGTLKDGHGVVLSGVRLTCTPINIAGQLISNAAVYTSVSDATGAITVTLIQGGRYQIKGNALEFANGMEVTIPSAASATFESFVAGSSYTLSGLTVFGPSGALSGLYTTLKLLGDVTVTQESPGVASATFSSSGGGGGTWGSITGTLSNQTDLQTALDAKEAVANKATGFGVVNNTLYPTVAAVKTYADALIANLINSAPGDLDTLDELAAALGDDPNFATTVTNSLAGKQPLDSDLTAIAALTPSNDDIIQRKAGAWVNRTLAQLKADLSLNNVENTALSTWAGSANITTLGTVAAGSFPGALLALTDVTTNDATAARHGFLPKLSGNASDVLKGDGSWAAAGSSGANAALSNLASVAINTALVSDTDNTDDLGTSGIRWKDIYGVRFVAGAGAMATPSIAIGGTNRGIYNRFSNAISFSCGGTLAAEIAATGIDIEAGQGFGWGIGGPNPSIMRAAAGVVEITNGSAGGLGKLLYGRVVTAKTSSYTVLAADKHTFFTNTGAAGSVTFTLPTAAVGLTYEFYRDANQTVQITAGASTTIRVGTSVTAAAGNVTLDAVGSKIRLVAISTTQWVGDVTGTATFT